MTRKNTAPEVRVAPMTDIVVRPIVKNQHDQKLDGHAMMFAGVVYRDSLGRHNGSGGGRTMLHFTCIREEEGCRAERLVSEYAVAEELDRIDQR